MTSENGHHLQTVKNLNASRLTLVLDISASFMENALDRQAKDRLLVFLLFIKY